MEPVPVNPPPNSPPAPGAKPKAGWPKGKPRKPVAGAGPSLVDAAARAQGRQNGAPGANPAGAAGPAKDAKCGKCGQGEGKYHCEACGREASPLTREATNVLADQYTAGMVFLANAIGGEGYTTSPDAVKALQANAREAAWVYRGYLNENLVLVGLLGTTAMVMVPAVMVRRARAKKAKDQAAKSAAEPTAGGKVVEMGAAS